MYIQNCISYLGRSSFRPLVLRQARDRAQTRNEVISSSLIAVRRQLHARVVGVGEVQLIAAAGAVGGIAIDGGLQSLLTQARGDPIRIIIVDADAEMVSPSWVGELVQTEKAGAEPEVDAAVARTAHDLQAQNSRIERGAPLDVRHGERHMVE